MKNNDGFIIKLNRAKEKRVSAVFDIDIEELLLWLCGFFGTMPIFMVLGNTFFLYLLMALVLLSLLKICSVKNAPYEFDRIAIPVVIIMALNVLSSVICIFGKLPDVYKDGTVSTLIVDLLYVFFFLLFLPVKRRKLVRNYLKGVHAASLVQLFYCILQIIYEHLTNSSLNETVFKQASWDNGVSGLCWHPSNLAPLFVYGCLMSRSPIIKLLFFGVSFLIGNRTAVLGISVCMLMQLAIYLYVNRGRFESSKHILIAIIIAIVGIALAIRFTTLGEVIRNQFDKFLNKTKSDISFDAHLYYWKSLPELIPVVTNWNILYPFFGVGSGNSGYIMSKTINMYPDIRWVIECDYVNDFWSYGLFGFLARYIFYFTYVIKSIKIDLRYLVFFISFFLMGITYNVMYGWCLLLVYSLILLISQGESMRCDQ